MVKIGGFQKSSLIDYPEKISAIVFTQGCNFRCPYCHNPELIERKRDENLFPSPLRGEGLGVRVFLDFLQTRIGKLDAVVITGGEPTLHKDLPEFIKQIKDLGFLVKLDTNGTNPEMLQKLIDENLIDYVAMDIKAPIEKYSEVVCGAVNTENILKSIEILKNTNAEYVALNLVQGRNVVRSCDSETSSERRTFIDFQYEFRTTVVKSQLSFDDFEQIGEMIKVSEKYYLQKFVPTKTLNRFFINQTTYSDEEFEPIVKTLEKYVKKVEVR